MAVTIINKDSLGFLKALSKNNNREWFNAHKARYQAAHENIIAFADAVLAGLNKHDNIETVSGKAGMFRIYKDVRFSKEKIPYNTHWSCAFKRATNKLRGGYYFRIQSGNSGLVGGFWAPNAPDMQRIRQDIDLNYTDWRKLLSRKSLTDTFGDLYGEQVSSAPRGYSKDHPAIDLLRYKQFLLKKTFTDKEVLSPGFLQQVNNTFKKIRPFFDYMSEVLTTNANGESIVE